MVMGWDDAAIALGTSIVGGLFGNKKSKPAVSTSKPVLLDTMDPALKAQAIALYNENLNAARKTETYDPYSGSYVADTSPYSQEAERMLNDTNLNVTWTPEERDLYSRMMGLGDTNASGAAVEQLIKSNEALGRRSYQDYLGDTRLAGNMYGSAGGGQVGAAAAREAARLGEGMAANSGQLRLSARQSDLDRALQATSAAGNIAQNPWQRALALMQEKSNRAGTLANMGANAQSVAQSGLMAQIENYYRDKERERTGNQDIMNTQFNNLLQLLGITQKQVGNESTSSGGTAGSSAGSSFGYEMGKWLGEDWTNKANNNGNGAVSSDDIYGMGWNNEPYTDPATGQQYYFNNNGSIDNSKSYGSNSH